MNTKISKKMMRLLALTLALAMALTSALSTGMLSNAAAKPKKITLKAKKATLYAGEQFQISLKSVKPKKADKKLKYTVDKKGKKFVKVSKKGLVTAKKVKKNGKAKVTVAAKKNKKAKVVVKITVKKGTVNKGISIKNQSILKGQSRRLAVTWNPAKTSSKKLSGWTSSNKKVATVSSNGTVKAIAKGTTKISVKNSYGKKANATITVTEKVQPKPTDPVIRVTTPPTTPPTNPPVIETDPPTNPPTNPPTDPPTDPPVPTGTPEPPMPTVNPPVTSFTSDDIIVLNSNQTILFSSFADGDAIDLNDYKEMRIKLTLFSDEAAETPIKEFTSDNSPKIKLTLDNSTASFGANGSWLAYVNNWVPGGSYRFPESALDADTGLITSELYNLTPLTENPTPGNPNAQWMTQEELDGTDCIVIEPLGDLPATVKAAKISALEFVQKSPAEPEKKEAPAITWYPIQGETADGVVSYDELPADDTRYNTAFSFGDKEFDLNFTADGIINQISKIAALPSEFEQWTNTSIYQADYGMFYLQAVGSGDTKALKVIDAYEGSEQFAADYVAKFEQGAEDNEFVLTMDSSNPRNTDVITITDDDTEGEVTLDGTLFGTPFKLVIDKATNSFTLEKDGALFAEFVNSNDKFALDFAADADVVVKASEDIRPVTTTEPPVGTEVEPIVPDLSDSANFTASGAIVAWDAAKEALRITSTDYNQGVLVKFTLPAGTTLGDYGRIVYDLQGAGATITYKNMWVGFNEIDTAGKLGTSVFQYLEASGWDTAETQYVNDEVMLTPTDTQAQTTGTVTIGLSLNGGAGEDYYIKNIRLTPVKSIEADVSNSEECKGLGATVEWDAAQEAAHVTCNNWGQGVVFKFDLPAGKKLGEYSSLEYDLKFAETPAVSYKSFFITSLDGFTGTLNTTNPFQCRQMYNGAGGTWQNNQLFHRLQSVLATSAEKTGTVYIGLTMNTSATEGGKEYYVKNVRLVEGA